MDTVTAPGDKAFRGILLANAITLVVAMVLGWSALDLMWPFWMQSVIIGWFARQRMLKLRDFSTEGLKMNGHSVAATPATRRKVANFFALHYGAFHLVYLVFLVTASSGSHGLAGLTTAKAAGTAAVTPLDTVAYLVLAFEFWRSHRASHLEHVQADLGGRPNLGTLMFMPYARVVPVHLTIIFGAQLDGVAVWLFVVLKTGADLLMHKVEHHVLGKSGAKSRRAHRNESQASDVA